MALVVQVKYLKDLGQGRWEYRRRVPEPVKAIIGKTEWKRVIPARSDAELLRAYGRVDAEFTREVMAAKAKTPKGRVQMTPRAAWEAALREAEELASMGAVGLDDPDEVREAVAESLVSLGHADPALIKALMDPKRPAPAYTLQDARDVYVKEKLGGGLSEEHRGTMTRIERVFRKAALGGLPASTALDAITREHARGVRDHMLRGDVAPASVKRELGILKAIITYGIRELGLTGKAHNPFDKLGVMGVGVSVAAQRIADRDKVDPLPPKIMAAMRGKLTGDLLLIWRLLEGTGCRLAEVTGLRVSDVILSGPTPHIRIEWHEGRRLKNLSSIRSVPLVGDALAAAQEAVKIAEGEHMLFPRYARPRGPDAASAALMKHLRGFTTDKRHKVHSLRHGMKDRLRMAGVDKIAQDVILGHAASNVGELYGGREGLLAVALRAMQTAHSVETSA